MQDFSEQVGEVYDALGDACDSAGEEELDQVMSMARGGGGGGGGGSRGISMSMAKCSAPMMSQQQNLSMNVPSSTQVRGLTMSSDMMMGSSEASKSKRKSKATSNIGGKKRLNDDVSSKLYKLSKQ